MAGVPIDFTDEDFVRAMEVVGGGYEGLAERFFDEQLEMLEEMRPPVVAHFDLVRLKAEVGVRDRDWRGWKGVWERVERNLRFVRGYGGVLEVNTAALRKGLEDAYPRREILEAWNGMGGRCTFSDDSHGVDQICTNYGKALGCVERAGIEELWCPFREEVDGKRGLGWRAVKLEEIRGRLKLQPLSTVPPA